MHFRLGLRVGLTKKKSYEEVHAGRVSAKIGRLQIESPFPKVLRSPL